MKKINPNQSKYDYLYESLKNKMDNISLTFDKEKISAEEMFEAINLYAKMLHSKGVRKGDLIGVSMFNTPEGVYLLYALNLLGAIVVGFDPFGKKEDIKNQLELTKPKMVITVDSAYNKFKGLSRSLDFSSILYSLSDRISDKKVRLQYELQKLMLLNFTLSKGKRLNSLVKKDYGEFFPKIPYVSGELRDIIFTGGSTGIPKGVELNDYALNAGVEGMKTMYEDGYFDGMIYLGQIPFGYMSFGKTVMHTALTNGATYALTLKAFPKDFYDELVRTNASGTSGGPIHWTSFIEEVSEGVYKPRSDLKPNSLKNLKLLFSGGEARREATIEPINRALEYCGCQGKIGEALGLTESYGFGIYNTGIFFKKGTLGIPVPGLEARLINSETKEEVEIGEIGVLQLSGLPVMMRYHKNEAETKKVIYFDEDGIRWLDTGDYLSKDADGFYKYHGREKRNFVSGCDNIYPERLEQFLPTIPGVREAVVVPFPLDLEQNTPVYYISLGIGDINVDALELKINKMVKKRFGDSWKPREIIFTNEPLKRMTSGKIDLKYYVDSCKQLGGITRSRKLAS